MRALAPRFWPGHLLAVVLTLAAVLLGLWQLDAWRAHREADARDLTHEKAVSLASLIGPDDPFPGTEVGQPVDLSGSWVPGGTVYVEGREHDGADGYWMVTPLATDASQGKSAVPVVLGWVTDPKTAPAAPTGQAEVTGWLQPPEGTGAVDDDPSDDELPQLRVADLVQHVDLDLYSAYVVSEHGELGLPAADLEQLPETGAFTSLRNFLYALQWWVFAAFAVVIWWRWLQEQLTLETQREAEGGEDGGPEGSDAPDVPDSPSGVGAEPPATVKS